MSDTEYIVSRLSRTQTDKQILDNILLCHGHFRVSELTTTGILLVLRSLHQNREVQLAPILPRAKPVMLLGPTVDFIHSLPELDIKNE